MVRFTNRDDGRPEVAQSDYEKSEAAVMAAISFIGEDVMHGATDGVAVAVLMNAVAKHLWRHLPTTGDARKHMSDLFGVFGEMIAQPAITALTPNMDKLTARTTDLSNSFVVAMDQTHLADFFDGETEQ